MKLLNHLGGVMISELVSSPVDHGFNHHQNNPSTIKLIFAVSSWINVSICGPISVSQNQHYKNPVSHCGQKQNGHHHHIEI